MFESGFCVFQWQGQPFSRKTKNLCTRLNLDGSFVETLVVDARENDYLILSLCPIREFSVQEEWKRIMDTCN